MSKKVNIEYDSDEFYIDGTILFRYYGDGGEVVVPDGIDTVEAEAFIDTEEVTSITFPKTFRSINGHAFAGCVNLEKFSFAEPNEIFHTIDGNIYRENGAVLATYAVGKKDAVFTVPESVKVIEAQAFYHADFLKEVILPEGVIAIEDGAFSYCLSLKKINLPESLKIIANEVFEGCKALESIELPDGLQYIGGHAFAYSGLKSITVPSKITAVSSEAFTDCKKLKDIVIPAALQYTAGYLSKKTVKKERV